MDELIEKCKLTTEEEWGCFDSVMKDAAKEDGISKKEYNDYCVVLSEDSRVWDIAAEISKKRLEKAIPLIAEEERKIIGEFLEESKEIFYAVYRDSEGEQTYTIARHALDKIIRTLKAGKPFSSKYIEK